MRTEHESTGTIFTIPVKSKDKWWLFARVDPGIVHFYSWLAKTNGWNIIPGSRYGFHISVVLGEKPKNISIWNSLNKQAYKYKYSIKTETNYKYAWLRVQSKCFEQIRLSLGLKPTPYIPFHLTLGRFHHVKSVQ